METDIVKKKSTIQKVFIQMAKIYYSTVDFRLAFDM